MISNFISLDKLRGIIRNYRFNVWLLEGRERNSGEKLSIIYAGHRANKNYISHLAFADTVKESYHGIIWLWAALRLHIKFPESHLIILEINEKLYKRFSDNAGLYIPCWIDGELYLEDVINRYKTSENIKSDLRKIRKYKLQYEVTHDRGLFDHFYYQMYVPHITRVHQDRALLMSHRVMIEKMDHCDLLLIKMEDEYIGGELLIYENDTVRAWSLGIKDGDMRYVKAGAVGAFYYFRTQYLADKGYQKIRMGASRAFLKDGVLTYKKKWGMRLIGPRYSGFWVRPNSMEKGMIDYLVHNPFVFERHGKLEGAIFINDVSQLSEDQIMKLYKDYYIGGLSRLNIYLCTEERTEIKVPDELSDSIVIRSIESLS